MEFHEKLQQLRKQHHLTQEQLAQQLFVSRTAVSKWESGRGYPNLESLKCLSGLFSVSIDELLSNDELIRLAETQTRSDISRLSNLVFGVLDLITAVFFGLPLFGQQDGNCIRAVTLLSHTGVSGLLRRLYFTVLVLIPAFGLFEIAVDLTDSERWLRLCRPASVGLSAAGILLFALSRQPYITAFLFLLFLAKVILMLREGRMN